MKGVCKKYRIKCDLTATEIVGPITMVGPRGLRSVVAHRFAVPVLVLWAGLRKSRKLNLDGEKILLGHLQSSAGDARMQMQVETSVGWFSLFK